MEQTSLHTSSSNPKVAKKGTRLPEPKVFKSRIYYYKLIDLVLWVSTWVRLVGYSLLIGFAISAVMLLALVGVVVAWQVSQGGWDSFSISIPNVIMFAKSYLYVPLIISVIAAFRLLK